MTPEELEAIRQRAEAATPGDWQCDVGASVFRYAIPQIALITDPDYGIPIDDDMVFIVHARTDIPALLAEVERLQAELTTSRRWAAAWKRAAKTYRAFHSAAQEVAFEWRSIAQERREWAAAWKRAAKHNHFSSGMFFDMAVEWRNKASKAREWARAWKNAAKWWRDWAGYEAQFYYGESRAYEKQAERETA